jgi:hypothetical protein
LIAAIISSVYVIDNLSSTPTLEALKKQQIFLISCLLLAVGTVYINYQVYQSIKLQTKVYSDWTGAGQYKAAEINSAFPWIPNITERLVPVACIKAKYLMNDHNEKEALRILNEDGRSNTYFFFT